MCVIVCLHMFFDCQGSVATLLVKTFEQHGVCFCDGIVFGFALCGTQRAANYSRTAGPPERPLPEIASQIQSLDDARSAFEEGGRLSVGEAFAAAKESLENRIGKVVEGALGSLSARPRKHVQATSMLSSGAGGRDESHAADTSAVLVKVFPMPAPDAAIKNKIAAIDRKQSHAESQLIKQAASEMEALVDIFINEVQEQLKLHMRAGRSGKGGAAGFLLARRGGGDDADALPPQLDLRVGASEVPFPTIESLVQQMENRRGASEESVRQHVLGLELQLLQAGNAILEERLRASLAAAKM